MDACTNNPPSVVGGMLAKPRRHMLQCRSQQPDQAAGRGALGQHPPAGLRYATCVHEQGVGANCGGRTTRPERPPRAHTACSRCPPRDQPGGGPAPRRRQAPLCRVPRNHDQRTGQWDRGGRASEPVTHAKLRAVPADQSTWPTAISRSRSRGDNLPDVHDAMDCPQHARKARPRGMPAWAAAIE